jgi:hypothetical protein
MKLRITNNLNKTPVIINLIWSVFILFLFIFRVPEFKNQRPEGASYLILGTIIITGFIFLVSLIFVVFANLFMKMKIYFDLEYVFIPIILLIILLFLN